MTEARAAAPWVLRVLRGLCVAVPVGAAAQEAGAPAAQGPDRQQVVVVGRREPSSAFEIRVSGDALARLRAGSGDTARLLRELPGVSLAGAGGVSSLPVLHGLSDDRIRIQVDGMDLVAACPNHMNPALSYIDPGRVASVRVHAGIAPVSAGGDSIGGAIQVDSAPPAFAEGEEPRLEGRVGGHVRTGSAGRGAELAARWASDTLSLAYHAATTRRANLRAAAAFKPVAPGTEGGPPLAGNVIASSGHAARNQELALAWRGGAHQLRLDLGHQQLGFEGFPNQRMDMTFNRGEQARLSYIGRFDGIELVARGWQQKVAHEMDMGPDRYRYGFGMPMDTRATTQGLRLDATWAAGDEALLRLGVERHTHVLYDAWPPVGGAMGPNTFWNIDDGQRDRVSAYAEWEGPLATGWWLQAGLRVGRVTTDTGKVQGYDNGLGAVWGQEAAAFNALARRRIDLHLDATLAARRETADGWRIEAGLARKTHSPNLHQRYAWSTQPMAALMNNLVGDGNGYIGDPDLRAEVAHTAALTLARRDLDADAWRWQATLHATHVHDFIDARRCDFGQCSAANVSATEGFVLLQHVNRNARLWGLDLSGALALWRDEAWGAFDVVASGSVLRGRDAVTGDPLHNLMPPELRLRLAHRREAWTADLEFTAVAAKRRVSAVRNEMTTPGHVLVDLRASHAWPGLRLDLAVENLFDRDHRPPLGGAYVGQGPSMTTGGIPWGVTVPGPGRTLVASLTLDF